MRYECEKCFGETQKPCVVIIPGKHELLFRFRCLVTSDHKAHFKPMEETDD